MFSTECTVLHHGEWFHSVLTRGQHCVTLQYTHKHSLSHTHTHLSWMTFIEGHRKGHPLLWLGDGCPRSDSIPVCQSDEVLPFPAMRTMKTTVHLKPDEHLLTDSNKPLNQYAKSLDWSRISQSLFSPYIFLWERAILVLSGGARVEHWHES